MQAQPDRRSSGINVCQERVGVGDLDIASVQRHLAVEQTAIQLVEVDRVAKPARQAVWSHPQSPLLRLESRG